MLSKFEKPQTQYKVLGYKHHWNIMKCFFFVQALQAKHFCTGQNGEKKTNSTFVPELQLLQLIMHQLFTWDCFCWALKKMEWGIWMAFQVLKVTSHPSLPLFLCTKRENMHEMANRTRPMMHNTMAVCHTCMKLLFETSLIIRRPLIRAHTCAWYALTKCVL